MATPVHYIRTIHTTFTAAHPHSSSAWASPSVARTHTHANILLNFTGVYNNNINTNINTNLPPMAKYPPGLQGANNVAVGRKRSASIRGMPPAYAQRMQSQRVKFDPFAEDSDSVLYNSHHTPAPRSVVTRPTVPIPYTIQIPPAAPADIQRHHQQQQQYRQHQHQQLQHQYQHRSQPVRARSPPQPQSPKPAPQRVSTPAPAPPPVTPTPTPAAAPLPNPVVAAKEREARSRIVAGILLNRVHAVGKPMRRRSPSADQPRPYVPSGLSTCIATEA